MNEIGGMEVSSTAPAVATHPLTILIPGRPGLFGIQPLSRFVATKHGWHWNHICWRSCTKIEHKPLIINTPANRGAIEFRIAPVVRGKMCNTGFHNRGSG